MTEDLKIQKIEVFYDPETFIKVVFLWCHIFLSTQKIFTQWHIDDHHNKNDNNHLIIIINDQCHAWGDGGATEARWDGRWKSPHWGCQVHFIIILSDTIISLGMSGPSHHHHKWHHYIVISIKITIIIATITSPISISPITIITNQHQYIKPMLIHHHSIIL